METAARAFVVVIQTLVLPRRRVIIIIIINNLIFMIILININDFKFDLSSFVESRDTAVPRASGRQRNSRMRDLMINVIIWH